jgi:hypothetical protein
MAGSPRQAVDDHLFDQVGGRIDRRCDGRGQLHGAQLLVAKAGGLAANQDDAAAIAAQCEGKPQYPSRVELTRRQQQIFRLRICHRRSLRLDDVNRPGRLAALGGIGEDCRGVAVEQCIGQLETADAEIFHRDPAGNERPVMRCATATPNPSSPLKMLPIPATRMGLIPGSPGPRAAPRRARKRSDGPAYGRNPARGPGRGDRHGEVNAILEIAFDRLDHRDPVLQYEIHDVGAAFRIEPHPVANRQFGAADPQRSEPRLVVDGGPRGVVLTFWRASELPRAAQCPVRG